MCNEDVRRAVRRSGLYQWEVAVKLGYSDAWFSKRLRRELAPEEKTRVLQAIKELVAERDGEEVGRDDS